MNAKQSAALSSVIILVLYMAGYGFHAALNGTFVLPASVLAVLAPLTLPIDYILTWALHGVATGDWTLPLPFPTPPSPGPVVPPVPPAP